MYLKKPFFLLQENPKSSFLHACFFDQYISERIKDPNFPVLIARVELRYKCQHRQLVNIQKFASSSLSACSISQVKYTYYPTLSTTKLVPCNDFNWY